MKICKYCAFLNAATNKGNLICTLLKIKYPYEPELYIRNPKQDACSQFTEKLSAEK